MTNQSLRKNDNVTAKAKGKKRVGKILKEDVCPFEHVRARLRWARSTRDTKLSKIHSKLSEVKEMKNELQAKLIEIALLERERDTAQMRVKQERIKYRGELMLFEEPINNQLDPRLMDGLSSDLGRFESLSISDGGAFETEVDEEYGNSVIGSDGSRG